MHLQIIQHIDGIFIEKQLSGKTDSTISKTLFFYIFVFYLVFPLVSFIHSVSRALCLLHQTL